MSACFFNFSHENRFALAGSAESYAALVLPYGSNPATDYLLSGETMRLIHDGAAHTRTAKVAEIAKNRGAMNSLKVCFENGDISRNCGICEKCVRTRLNVLATGVEDPPCFDGPLDIELIRSLVLFDDLQKAEFSAIANYARQHGVSGRWLDTLEAKLASATPVSKWQSSVTTRRLRKLRMLARSGDFGLILEKLGRRITKKMPEVNR
jgi:hypothetical protein